ELISIVKKASGYLNIGLEKLTEDIGERDTEHCTTLMQNYPLSSIFRVGFGLALELKWRAERWLKKCWFSNKGLPLSFWGEEWMGALGGLLIKKPLFYDNYKTGELYREFISIDDIKKTEYILNEIIAFDELFSLISIEPDPAAKGYLTYKNFILTLWVRHTLGLSEKLIPLTFDEFRGFFDDLWADKEQLRKTSLSIKESFLDWVSRKTGLVHYEISQRLGQSFENLFKEIESEYGKVSRNDLDPRYIHLFLIDIKKGGN
ncbi:MAG: SWIRM domain-containing protein, partial [Desulfobacteraceae bacterium]|nr:SWIRM domain-containing protein [Desulfobacteraceae bacterium]